MPDYDFLNLSTFDFEKLTRDVLQEQYDIDLESFTTGKDGGIDLRYSKEKNNDLIVQCKRYNNYISLKSNLKKEYQKVKILNPQKYILSTSVGLTPLNKDEIIKIFNGCIKGPSDIFGKNDLNNLLGKYPEIERKHFKLWFSSTNILQKLLHNDIISRSEFEKEDILREIKVYVQNKSYSEAFNILNQHNYVLISGIPGIGKTTLAKILICKYLIKGYELVVVSSDINEAESLYERGKKQLFYYDDFLGSNFLEERLKKNEDQKLVRFIKKIKNVSNKKLIMTTREYILSQAKLKYEIFADSNLEIAKCIIDLEKYLKLIRAEILYNHLFYSNLPPGYIYALLTDKSYLKIIDHPNYSPRIIQIMTDKDVVGRISERGFFDFFIKNLNNPINIWEHSFTNQISKSSQHLLYIMLVSNDQIFEDDLEKSFWELYKNESNELNFEINREDFINSLKELENTFIKISKVQSGRSYGLVKKKKTKNIIQFQNPSIRDFLINKVRNNINLISSLIDSAIYLNQLFDIYRIYSENKSHKILVDDDLVSKLINNIIQKFDNLESIKMHTYYENANKSYWEVEKLSNIKKLYDLASFFNLFF
jgi:DNA polymerase III delta prime subunit